MLASERRNREERAATKELAKELAQAPVPQTAPAPLQSLGLQSSPKSLARQPQKETYVPHPALTTAQILTALSETPLRIAELTAGLTAAQLRTPPAPGAWSANDVLAHLRACADVWGACILTLLNQNRPTLRAVNPRTWIKGTTYLEQAFQPSLQAFTAQRDALSTVLEPLPSEAWWRSATVTGAGRPLERTVHAYAQWLVSHERPHVKQIQRIAGAMRLEQEANAARP